MAERTIEDHLREEYIDILPEIQRVVWQLEAEVRFHTLPILHTLKKPEQLIVRSRVKDCESAITTLRRVSKREGRTFDLEPPGAISLRSLPDLAGVRVLVFPDRRLKEVDEVLRRRFPDWVPKPLINPQGLLLARKYSGICNEASKAVCGEYQIVPMLVGLFWDVEHSAMYKFKPVANSKEMRGLKSKVEGALAEFEQGIASFLK
jgi:hypothetical protein